MKNFIWTIVLLYVFSFCQGQTFEGTKKESHFFTPLISMPFVFESGKPATVLPRFTINNFASRYYYGWGVPALFAGLGSQNIGIISRSGDTTYKRRVLTIYPEVGVRLGFKKGGISLGGALDLAVNYKEKKIVGAWKGKERGFFSKKTERFLPSVFMGISYNFMEIKMQYFFPNFLNAKRSEFMNLQSSMVNLGLSLNHLYLQQLLKSISPPKKNKKDKDTPTANQT